MRRRVVLLLCVLSLAALAVGAATASDQPASEETHLEVQLDEDGDAEWSIVAVVLLEGEEEAEDFEAFGEEFEAGEHDLDLGYAAFERAAEEASTASDREMEVHSPSRHSAVHNETVDGETVYWGELEVRFTWESFAREDDDRLVVDDAFNTTDGTWLSGLEADQRLSVRSPEGYAPTTAPIGATAGDLHWEGPETFEPGYFVIVYQPTGPGPAGLHLSTMLLGGAFVLSAAALLVGVYLLWGRRDSGRAPPADAPTRPTASSTGPGEPSGATPTKATDGDVSVERAAGAGAAGAGSGAAGAGTAGAGAAHESEPDLELLSDEERVEYLLERNGGRMKQAQIVEDTGWSNAKVSQLLSSMADDGRVDKLRIGRENLISLPDEDITDIAGRADGEE